MRKLLVAAALLLSFSSVAMAKGKAPLTVKSGEVQATVDGKVVTYKMGDTVPEGAQLTATSDAQLTSGGAVIDVPSGASVQAVVANNGYVDVRCNSGAITVTSPGGAKASLGAGSEVQTGMVSGFVQVAGTSTVTNNGHQKTIAAGQAAGVSWNGSVYTFTSSSDSLLPPPPPNPLQDNKIVPVVSPSAP